MGGVTYIIWANTREIFQFLYGRYMKTMDTNVQNLMMHEGV